MARLSLADGVTLQQVGETVLKIAEERMNKADASDLLDPLFTGSYTIEVVFDSETVRHIIIPWLGSNKYYGNPMAHECMGFIVFGGCGL